jgi:hypothetical protein
MTDAPTRGMRWTAPGWRSTVLFTLQWVVASAVAAALFPRRTRWMRWPYGLTPRGRLVYALVSGALLFAIGELAHHLRLWRNELVAELRDELGREPTDNEIQRHGREKTARAALEEHLGRAPTEQEVQRFLETH